MEIEKKEKYTYINLKKNIKNSFFTSFKEKISTFENQHLILNLLNLEVFEDDIISFLTEKSAISRKNGTSFVVMSEVLDAGEYEGIINIVPTLNEAIDLLEMEEIERDLGF